jgi:hypothetical protein
LEKARLISSNPWKFHGKNFPWPQGGGSGKQSLENMPHPVPPLKYNARCHFFGHE